MPENIGKVIMVWFWLVIGTPCNSKSNEIKVKMAGVWKNIARVRNCPDITLLIVLTNLKSKEKLGKNWDKKEFFQIKKKLEEKVGK